MLARNTIFLITATIIAAFSLSDANSKELVWGENVGPVFAEVARSEDGKGVSVHAAPSEKSGTIAQLKKGSQVQGYNKFKNGWMQLKRPYKGGWVKVSFLKPRSFEQRVTRVAPPEFCVPLRKGPGSAHPKAGCAGIGQRLTFSGVMTADNWLQLTKGKGWMLVSNIRISPAAVAAPGKVKGKSTGPVVAPLIPGNTSLKTVSDRFREVGIGTGAVPGLPGTGTGTGPPRENVPPPVQNPPGTFCRGEYCYKASEPEDPVSGYTRDGIPIHPINCNTAFNCALVTADYVTAILQGGQETRVLLNETVAVYADGTIAEIAPLGEGEGPVIANCGTAQGIDPECVAQVIQELAQQAAEEAGPPQNQMAGSGGGAATLEGGGQGGTGSLAPPAEIPGSGDSGPVLTGKKEEDTDGTSETSGDESSGWMTIQPVGGNPPAESGGGSGPSETAGSGKGDDSGWRTIQPVGGSGPVFTSEGDDGKDFGGGKKDAPVIGGGGNPPAGPTQGFIVGDPVDSDFGGNDSSDSSSSGPGFGGSAPGVSISEPSEFTGRGGVSGGANESTGGGFSRGDAADFGGGSNVGGDSSVSSGSPSGSSGSDLGSSTAQGVSMSDSSAATGKTGGGSSSGGTGGVSITKGFKGRR